MHQPRDMLSAIADIADEDIDLGAAALALAALDRPAKPLDDYQDHLAALVRDVGDAVGKAPSLEDRRAALNDVILDQHGYQGDTQTYDDIRNANLMHVIDRRKGLPVALGILYIATARSQGWSVSGLNFPGHFLIRFEAESERAIVDPFNHGRRRDAADLRDLLKLSAGLDAELDPSHYAPVSNRDVLIRLQNNIKARHMQSGDMDGAARVIERMLLFAPDVAPLWRESGAVLTRQGRLGAAIEAFERYATLTRSEEARLEAATLIQKLRQRLN